MRQTLEDHRTTISIAGRPLCNRRFADDIDLMAGSNSELQTLTNKLVDSAAAFGMEISSEKSKVMVSSREETKTSIVMNGKLLEEVSEFKYLGSVLSKDGSSTKEIRTRIAMATAAMTKLQKIWKSDISIQVKVKLYKSLVVSILLYGCETWTLMADTERRIQAFEMKCFRKLLRISYREHRTNVSVLNEIEDLVGAQEPLLGTIKRRKLAWFGHVTRHDGLCKTVLQGTVEGARGKGRPRKSWTDNIKKWTAMKCHDLLVAAQDRPRWRRIVDSSASLSPQRQPSRGTR